MAGFTETTSPMTTTELYKTIFRALEMAETEKQI